jgi:ATP-binding cassette subfamily C (CFTR/MRP) protein 4
MILIFSVPCSSLDYIGKMFSVYRFKIAQKTDERGRIMNEIIIAMRVIKMYAWENPFSKLIDHVRRLATKHKSQCRNSSNNSRIWNNVC